MKPKALQSLNIDTELHKSIRIAAAETGHQMKELVRLAWEAYASMGRAAPPPTPAVTGYNPANRELHDKLETVLNSGDEMTIRAVVPNIEIFFERLRPASVRRANGK